MKKIIVLICCIFILFSSIATGSAVYAATTPTSGSFTPQPSVIYTPTDTPSVTPTTTLMPLPAITLIFPASTSTVTPTVTPEPIPFTSTPNPAVHAVLEELPPRIKVLLVFVSVLWIVLAGFVIIYIRQLR